MMLPINNTSPANSARMPIVIGVIGADSKLIEHLTALCPVNVNLLPIYEELRTEDVIGSCDAVIGVIDGDVGLKPELINSWSLAKDTDIPRLILAGHTVTGRADFDEVLALSELVLDEDVAIRYYPIVDDEAKNYVGLLDVLEQSIIHKQGQVKPADPEHISLTQDDRDELIDLLIHSDLDGDLLHSKNLGLPISFPKLRQLWQQTDLVTVLPIDQWVSDQEIIEWLKARKPIWLPDVFEDGIGKNLADCHDTLGIGIGLGVARIWPNQNDENLVLITEQDEQIEIGQLKASGIYLNSRVRPGDTIRPKHSNYLLTSPRF